MSTGMLALRQTRALLVDSYRELSSKKLFWLTLILSALVVLAFAAVRLTDDGIKLLFWEFEVEFLNRQTLEPADFYTRLFVHFGIGFWLAWLASILALVSTAGLFPDMLATGSVELSLTKPISRWRLLLTKYALGLLFVALQVGVFSLASFLVIGVMGGAWKPRIFLAVPVVLVFFSYLFSVCMLLGLVTRSTIAALLLTLLFWLFLFCLNAADTVVLQGRLAAELRSERAEAALERVRALPEGEQGRMEELRRRAEELRASTKGWGKAAGIAGVAKTIFPKTGETIQLLDRWLIPEDRTDDAGAPAGEGETPSLWSGRMSKRDQELIGKRLREKLNERSLGWVLGTSLAFEGVVLVLAGWRFSRRDF